MHVKVGRRLRKVADRQRASRRQVSGIEGWAQTPQDTTSPVALVARPNSQNTNGSLRPRNLRISGTATQTSGRSNNTYSAQRYGDGLSPGSRSGHRDTDRSSKGSLITPKCEVRTPQDTGRGREFKGSHGAVESLRQLHPRCEEEIG
jgi:hypothetical protein